MPSLIDIRRRDPLGQEHAADHQGHEDGLGGEAAPRAGAHRHARARTRRRCCGCFNNLATRVETADASAAERRPRSRAATLLIVITADRGLCGSFNTNVIKAALQFIDRPAQGPQGRDVALALVGRKGRDFFKRRGFDVRYEASRPLPAAQVVARAGDRQTGDRGVPRAGRRRGLPRLQRVQVGHLAARRGRAAAADSARRARGATTATPAERTGAVDYLYEPDAASRSSPMLLPMHVERADLPRAARIAAAEHARAHDGDGQRRRSNATDMIDR